MLSYNVPAKMQVLQVSEVAVKVLLGSKLKKTTDEFDAHSRFMDDRIPGLVTLTIRVWIKRVLFS